MTSFRIERLRFSRAELDAWGPLSVQHRNWPVVYTVNDDRDVYVGETRNALGRMRQHLDNPAKRHLDEVRVVVDETFNKSACMDLESFLIRLFAGDGRYTVLNRNEGITDADYYDRERYQRSFREVFEELRLAGMFTRGIPQIENDDLFKYSPFKALTQDQAIAIEGILEGLFADLERGESSTTVVQGDPGTGKTIVAIYLMKLLKDIELNRDAADRDSDSLFSEFFAEGHAELLQGFRIGLVVPQQSLRRSVQNVFHRTPGLTRGMVLTPFQVGRSTERFDLLVVDETHRLNQRANMSSGVLNRQFAEINERLFGADDLAMTQLDWIVAQSRHRLFLVDAEQSVRPADLPPVVLERLVADAHREHRWHPLVSQMRVAGGADYIDFVKRMLSGRPVSLPDLGHYEFRLFDDLGAMHEEIRRKDADAGLSRLVAGYAWPWRSKNDPSAFDIELDGCRLRWNSTDVDWINSPGSLDEVGSIHTVQGYDLNYAGVIIGPELRYDPAAGRLFVERDRYHDKKGKENNAKLGISYTDDDLLRFITNIYRVLLTRGMRGTFVYVCDPELRELFARMLHGEV